MRIMLVTDRRIRPIATLWTMLPAMARAGLTDLLLREKDLPGGPLLALAHETIRHCRPLGIALFVSDRIDVALAAETDGVQLPASGIPVRDARALIAARRGREGSPQCAIGASTHAKAEVRDAFEGGASHVLFGPVFATASKLAYGAPHGTDGLAEICASAPGPVLAIGGITPERAVGLRGTGIAGIAAIGAILDAPDPATAVRELAEALRS